MSSFDRTPIVVYCPRCKMALPPESKYCYFCGLLIAQVLPGTSIQLLEPSFEPNTHTDRSLRRHRSVVIYGTSMLLLVGVCALSVLHFTGISPCLSSHIERLALRTSCTLCRKGPPFLLTAFPVMHLDGISNLLKAIIRLPWGIAC